MRFSGRRLEGAARCGRMVRDFPARAARRRGFLFLAAAIVGRHVQSLDGVLPAGGHGAAPDAGRTISRPCARTLRSGRPSRRCSPAPSRRRRCTLMPETEPGLSSIGEIGEALSAALGTTMRCWCSASACSAPPSPPRSSRRSLCHGASGRFFRAIRRRERLFNSRRFLAFYAASLRRRALVRFSGDLVWLNIAAQVANALVFPLVGRAADRLDGESLGPGFACAAPGSQSWSCSRRASD